MTKLKTKRIYEPVEITDGLRVLVDRLWPRGFTKERANVDVWLKTIAPSADLRKWFNHDIKNWDEFNARYLFELKQNSAVKELLDLLAKNETVTLLYAAHDDQHNHAIVLQQFIDTLN
jgi:uncharacterized protein YeaO (DUF488 family)